MDPRLKSSTKWTPFPEELCQQIYDVFTENFADYDLTGRFVVEGKIYPEELWLRVGLNDPNRLRQDNFEASMEYGAEDDKAIERIHLLVDLLGEIWKDFLEGDAEEDMEPPRTWQPQRFEKQDLFFRYSTVNSDLEKQAEALLQLDEKRLVHESAEEDDMDAEMESSEHTCDDPNHVH